MGEKRPAGDSTWDSTVTLKRVVNSKSLIKCRPEKKKNFEVVQVKLIFQYYKIILMYIKMVQRQRRHEFKTKSTYNE